MNTVKLPKLRCKRCGHKWIPRKEGEEPRVCPKCKSPYWNREKIRKGDKKLEAKLKNGN